MAIVQCSRAHYYDNEKFNECPHCLKLQSRGMSEDETVTVAFEARQVENYAVEYIKRNAAAQHQQINVSTAGKQVPPLPKAAGDDEERTISIFEKRGISRCTVGWLVCVQGEDYGQDFPLYAGFNRIGRVHGSDIVLKDPQVSRKEHCSVIYEEKKNVFYVLPAAGNLTYVGGEMVNQAQMIESGQVITIGETKLEFIAFCTGEKRWEKRV